MRMNKDAKNILRSNIAGYRAELDFDAIGLWQVLHCLNRLKLSDAEFKQCLRQFVLSLMQDYAIPVVATGDDYEWEQIDTLGTTAKDVADNISAKWSKHIKIEDSIFGAGGVWFAKPVPEKNYVRLLEKSNFDATKIKAYAAYGNRLHVERNVLKEIEWRNMLQNRRRNISKVIRKILFNKK
jgi:hypothetical protein